MIITTPAESSSSTKVISHQHQIKVRKTSMIMIAMLLVRCLTPDELMLPKNLIHVTLQISCSAQAFQKLFTFLLLDFFNDIYMTCFFCCYFILASKKELKEASKLHQMMRPCEVLVHKQGKLEQSSATVTLHMILHFFAIWLMQIHLIHPSFP